MIRLVGCAVMVTSLAVGWAKFSLDIKQGFASLVIALTSGCQAAVLFWRTNSFRSRDHRSVTSHEAVPRLCGIPSLAEQKPYQVGWLKWGLLRPQISSSHFSEVAKMGSILTPNLFFSEVAKMGDPKSLPATFPRWLKWGLLRPQISSSHFSEVAKMGATLTPNFFKPLF